MSEYRLKIKIGNHEFEAEGPADAVAKQFSDFKEIISKIPDVPVVVATPTAPALSDAAPGPAGNNPLPPPASALNKIFRVEGRVISMTALPGSENDAALLIMLGQKELRDNDAATGSEIKDGLELSGYKPGRIDRTMERFVADGLVLTMGKNRGRKYRLTNQGLVKAQAIADELQRKVP
ncbi:MAG: hypothetical protein ABSB39_22050 [Candidatus Sulfotelmatobacter sp.]